MRDTPIRHVDVSAFSIPTDAPESDGTFEWAATTLIVAAVDAGGETGIGYTYADVSAGKLIQSVLAEAVVGVEALHTGAAWMSMVKAIRNLGRPGIASMAISAVDTALWDLKGKLLNAPVSDLLGRVHQDLPLYGSGGFTSYENSRLTEQLGGWASEGFRAVKMKIGRQPDLDLKRLEVARIAIGSELDLMIDANGAFERKEALAFAVGAGQFGVTWFEEPVSSEDLDGLRLLRDRAPPPIAISAGEYGFDSRYFKRMLAAGAVDVLQADATRCAGITGFMKAAALAEAFEVPLSSHCAPALHVHPCAAVPKIAHMEWFYDHVRIESTFFEGGPRAISGVVRPSEQPGLGLVLKRADLERYKIN